MKKSLLVIALGIFALNASATTRKEERVHYLERPTQFGAKMAGLNLTTLTVEVDGTVRRSDCPNLNEIPCNTRVVAKLNAYKMDEIEGLIKDAKDQKNKLVRSKTQARCFAPASKERFISADHETVKLEKGDICSTLFVSNTAAGTKLTAIVHELVRKTTRN